ncbi:MAG: hypothetical protein ACI4VL_02880 [Bacilli bacterium]
MKKSFIITFIVLLSSFFFISNEVKASELTLDISLDKITDTFLNIKNLSDEFINNNDFDTYIIVYTDDYYVYFFKNSNNNEFNCNNYNTDLYCSFYFQNSKYKLSNDILVSTGISSSNFTSYNYKSKFNNILYSSIIPLYKGSSTDILNLNYNSKTLTILYGETIPLVYDLYLLDNPLDNPHQEEIEKVDSFYTIVIDKMSYLVKEMSNNYIYLSIFVIFIFIFVFELIRRRFL